MGTVILTGANGSLAVPAVEHLLKNHPKLAAVLTVRNPSATDSNTQHLRNVISKYPNAKASIYGLDLSSLSAVNSFADEIVAGISRGQYPPLKSIICNAYYWNLVGDVELTEDGYEKTLQVNHISHAVLSLRLLGHFGPDGGRVVVFSSDAHWPGKNMLEKFPPEIPADLEQLANLGADPEAEKLGRGFQRYANSKLVITSWMYALNRHLLEDPGLGKITAVAINPGNLVDSRALRTNTPKSLVLMQRFIIRPFVSLLRILADPTMRTAREAAVDVVELGLSAAHPGERGFFTLLEKDRSSPESLDEEKQQKLWVKTLEWGKVTQDKTALKVPSQ